MPKERVLLGSAGTGKTTYCLNKVQEWVDNGIPMNSIAYMSFSTKASREPVSRIGDYSDDDLYWFRTLHSAAFNILGLSRKSVCTDKAIRKYANDNGYSYRGDVVLVDDMDTTETDILDVSLAIHNVARNRLCSAKDVIKEYGVDYSIKDVEETIARYEAWKSNDGYIDFTDVLMLVEDGMTIPVTKVIIDEAQDLTPLQHKVVDIFFSDADEILFAGDDDQALYAWAGADVEGFIAKAKSCPLDILDQSYRVPATVHALGQDIIQQCKNRVRKTYRPREAAGSIVSADLQDIDMSKGDWLLLARNRFLLSSFVSYVKDSGYAYAMSDGTSCISTNEAYAIYDWESLRKGKSISTARALNVYDNMMAGIGYERGSKQALATSTFNSVDMLLLKEEFGLLVSDSKPWFEALNKISADNIMYMRNVLRNGDNVFKPRITISTIHSAKGGEADNVVLLCDTSKRVSDCINDDEHRVWYVAVTRTKETLYIVPPTGRYYYDPVADAV